MGLKRKDFQKAAAFLKEFLLKLNEDTECAELRDTLTLALLHMQKYYRLLQCRTQERTSQHQLSLSARGLSPMTPFVDAPDKFQWKWTSLDSAKYSTSSTRQDEGFYQLPDIILATREGNMEWITKIIQQGPALLDETDGLGRNGLFYAIHYNNLNVLKYLLDNGADPNVVAHDGSSPIHKACHDGNYIALELLIEHGGDIHAQDTQLRAPIHWAVTTPGLDCLQNLIRNKADVNARDKDGLTPCMWACRVDHIKHFEMLYKSNNIMLNSKESETDDSGRTWLHWAVRRTEPLKCLQLLLSKDSAALRDEDGKTVILVAAEQGSFPACKLIFELAGPDVIYDRDNMDRTALHLATIRGHGTVLNFLLENGADLELRDRFEATAWDYAKNRQLHYCQLIMMSHKRQSLQSSPRDLRSNGDISGGGNGNLEPWNKIQENSSELGRIPYNSGLTDRSSNGDLSSRKGTSRNRAIAGVMNNINNNNSNNDNYHNIKINIDNNGDNEIPGSKLTVVKMNPQPLQVYGTGSPVYSKTYYKENEVMPVKDLISSPCPPKKPRTGPCLARASFQHRSLSESFERHPSNIQSVDYAEMDPVEMSRSEGTESRLGVYERSNSLDNHHMPHNQDMENCADHHMHPDSNEEEIEVISGEMDVSNIDEDDQRPSPIEIVGNFNYDDPHPNPGFPYPPQSSYSNPTPSAPYLQEVTPHPELHNQEGPELSNSAIGVGFPCPRPPPPPITSSHKGSHTSGILLNRRPLLSRNQPKSQPLPRQPLKLRNSSAKTSVPRPTGNPKMVHTYKGKGPKPGSFGSDTSEEQNENGSSLSWQGLMNAPAALTAPVNPIMSQQEPLPKFLHRGSMPPPGPNPGTGTNFIHNAWPTERHGGSDLTSANSKLSEMSDLGFSAPDAGPGTKDMTEPQDGTILQHHLSPSSSTSSLSLAHNKSGSANVFHMSVKPAGPSLGGQKSDIRRLPSALIPLTNAPPLPQGNPIARKKKKKRKKQENQDLHFENTVVEGKSLQNSALPHNQLGGIRPLAPGTGLSALSADKTDHHNQGMELTPPIPPMQNSQRNPDTKIITSANKGRGRAGGLWMAPSTRQDIQQASGPQGEVDDGQRAARREDGFNDLTTVGTGLFGKKPAPMDNKSHNLPLPVNNSEETNRDLMCGKLIPVPSAKDKWSLPENGLPSSSKKQLKPASPFSLVEPELVKTKPPLPYTRKSLPP